MEQQKNCMEAIMGPIEKKPFWTLRPTQQKSAPSLSIHSGPDEV
jgi:hypothetical protein